MFQDVMGWLMRSTFDSVHSLVELLADSVFFPVTSEDEDDDDAAVLARFPRFALDMKVFFRIAHWCAKSHAHSASWPSPLRTVFPHALVSISNLLKLRTTFTVILVQQLIAFKGSSLTTAGTSKLHASMSRISDTDSNIVARDMWVGLWVRLISDTDHALVLSDIDSVIQVAAATPADVQSAHDGAGEGAQTAQHQDTQATLSGDAQSPRSLATACGLQIVSPGSVAAVSATPSANSTGMPAEVCLSLDSLYHFGLPQLDDVIITTHMLHAFSRSLETMLIRNAFHDIPGWAVPKCTSALVGPPAASDGDGGNGSTTVEMLKLYSLPAIETWADDDHGTNTHLYPFAGNITVLQRPKGLCIQIGQLHPSIPIFLSAGEHDKLPSPVPVPAWVVGNQSGSKLVKNITNPNCFVAMVGATVRVDVATGEVMTPTQRLADLESQKLANGLVSFLSEFRAAGQTLLNDEAKSTTQAVKKFRSSVTTFVEKFAGEELAESLRQLESSNRELRPMRELKLTIPCVAINDKDLASVYPSEARETLNVEERGVPLLLDPLWKKLFQPAVPDYVDDLFGVPEPKAKGKAKAKAKPKAAAKPVTAPDVLKTQFGPCAAIAQLRSSLTGHVEAPTSTSPEDKIKIRLQHLSS